MKSKTFIQKYKTSTGQLGSRLNIASHPSLIKNLNEVSAKIGLDRLLSPNLNNGEKASIIYNTLINDTADFFLFRDCDNSLPEEYSGLTGPGLILAAKIIAYSGIPLVRFVGMNTRYDLYTRADFLEAVKWLTNKDSGVRTLEFRDGSLGNEIIALSRLVASKDSNIHTLICIKNFLKAAECVAMTEAIASQHSSIHTFSLTGENLRGPESVEIVRLVISQHSSIHTFNFGGNQIADHAGAEILRLLANKHCNFSINLQYNGLLEYYREMAQKIMNLSKLHVPYNKLLPELMQTDLVLDSHFSKDLVSLIGEYAVETPIDIQL